jgi:glycosyltransferase involved in cell wall biosynthesis
VTEKSKVVWILQTGEPLHIDSDGRRPMRAMNLANQLLKDGHKVVVWSSRFDHSTKAFRGEDESPLLPAGLEYRLLSSTGYRRNLGPGRLIDHALMALNLWRELRWIAQTDYPDVVFVGYPPIEVAWVLTRWAKAKNIPTLLDIKDLWPEIFLSVGPDFLQPLVKLAFAPYFVMARATMKNATKITGMTAAVTSWAHRFARIPEQTGATFFPLAPLVYKPEKIDDENARIWAEALIKAPENTLTVLYVGNFTRTLNFTPLLEFLRIARERLFEVRLIICGGGDSQSEITELFSKFDEVIFPGWVSRQQHIALARHCDFALVPYHSFSDFELSIPNKVLDSLALGMPILTSLDGETRALVENHELGKFYVNGLDIYEFANEQNLATFSEMKRNALNVYQTQYNGEKIYEGLARYLVSLSSC